ncbi:hypothetical protein HMPREF3033_01180 [Veillonellaceae bacterium DNF00751]|nr:hypothetical protein HMPREF3033_01180 [Veillonellaceae bacterium DNF00751]
MKNKFESAYNAHSPNHLHYTIGLYIILWYKSKKRFLPPFPYAIFFFTFSPSINRIEKSNM